MKAAVADFPSLTEQVHAEVRSVLDQTLANAAYSTAEVPGWVDNITSGVLQKLQNMSDQFKYIVSVIILQRSNAGFHMFSTCYWDQNNDGTVTVKWENRSMHCVVSVYGVAI